MPCNSVPRVNSGAPIKEEPTSGDKCNCAECRGEVVIKGERLETEDEMNEYVRYEVQPQDHVQSEAKSKDDHCSASSVHTPELVPTFANKLDEENTGKESNYVPRLYFNQFPCR